MELISRQRVTCLGNPTYHSTILLSYQFVMSACFIHISLDSDPNRTTRELPHRRGRFRERRLAERTDSYVLAMARGEPRSTLATERRKMLTTIRTQGIAAPKSLVPLPFATSDESAMRRFEPLSVEVRRSCHRERLSGQARRRALRPHWLPVLGAMRFRPALLLVCAAASAAAAVATRADAFLPECTEEQLKMKWGSKDCFV
jgi:hypothetical protein